MSMTPQNFKTMRLQLGLTQSQLADRLRISDVRSIRRWEAGERAISGPVQVALHYMVHGHHPDDLAGK